MKGEVMKETVWEILEVIAEAIKIIVGDGRVESNEKEKD